MNPFDMPVVNVTLTIPLRPASKWVQVTSRKFEFHSAWGTVYVCRRVGMYWEVTFPNHNRFKWRTPYYRLWTLKLWFAQKETPLFEVKG